MRNDRRLNGWVLIASVLGIISGLTLLVAGAGVGIWGFLKPKQLLKMDIVDVIANHNWIVKLQKSVFNELLKTKFLFLFVGAIVAVIGLLVLIFATKGLIYVKKRKVVRRRVALLLFSILPLAIAVAGVFFIIKFDVFANSIKNISKTINNFLDILQYASYGVTGVFGAIGLFNILGVLFGRSEKFMSNDNSKYAFDNSSIKSARANVNNNVKDAQVQSNVAQPRLNQPQQRPQMPMQQRPPMPNPNARAMQTNQRPNQAQQRPMQPGMRPQMPAQHGQQVRATASRQPINANMQGSSRPVSSMSQGMSQRPAQATRPQYQPSTKYCAKCGKLLAPGEKFCSLCGHKSAE